MSARYASLVVLAVLAARCTFPDVSMGASNGASGDGLPASEGGDPTRDSFPFVDGGLREGDAQTDDASVDGSVQSLDGNADASTTALDASEPTAEGGPPADAGKPPVDASKPPVDASKPAADAGPPGVDAAEPPQEAGTIHDAGHKKQYPADIDCTSVDIADCNSTTGFADDPDCGDTGTLVQCGTSTTRDNSGNGNDEASGKDKESCVILLQITAVQTCL